HPDIEDFIQTKVKEEEKIRALRDAGFDMDLGSDDITSVSRDALLRLWHAPGRVGPGSGSGR
ncbi:hypothetical protein ABZ642_45855, partial [Streptomyces sp. NPDC007157]|uniref:hypothetical protein n=1 Tax=Streptomyces sp. NPDC007157 TaxID=3154681 RepID=UPI0033DF9479